MSETIDLLVIAIVFATAVPSSWLAWSTSLDVSWPSVINWGLSSGKQFGQDIIYPEGPLGFLYTVVGSVALELVIVLRRRPRNDSLVVSDPIDCSGRMGNWISLPSRSGGLLWAEIGIDKNWAGRIAGLVYTPPVVTLSVRLADGEVRPHRLIVATAETGFLLSPLVAKASEFAALDGDVDSAMPPDVAALRIDGPRHEWFWRQTFTCRTYWLSRS